MGQYRGLESERNQIKSGRVCALESEKKIIQLHATLLACVRV